ncbi:MAG: hypothetical protein K2G13_09375, partial [Muribaculaceae bacterium]|nr:hypothetical protein [Muribaculaceae bacterium]
HILFLSDDEKQNLHDVSVLLNDSALRAFAGCSSNSLSSEESLYDRGKVIFYCHARFNGVHRVIEDQHYSNNLEVRIIDSSHLNVELLKRNAEILPVNFVEVEPDATVSSAFNAMVVGFDEVGRDVVRYLYEFGAFVKSGADSDHAVRSDFHLDVIDRGMKDKAGLFIAATPSVRCSIPFIEGMNNPDALIELHGEDYRSVGFYMKLKEKIETLNYIVITTDDDELNMSLGVNVFKEAVRYRENLDDLCILVRIHNDDDGHFSKIAQYYNRLWAAQEKSDVAGRYRNNAVRSFDDCKLPLYIFGSDEDIYTYNNIIDNAEIREAARHRELYTASTESGYVMQDKEENMKWYRDVEDLLQTKDEFHPCYARMMKLRRTQCQD